MSHRRYRNAVLPGSVVAVLILAGASCSRKLPPSEFQKIAGDFVYRTLSFSPVLATAQGLHTYEGRSLDSELDDLRFRALQKRRDYYGSVHRRLTPSTATTYRRKIAPMRTSSTPDAASPSLKPTWRVRGRAGPRCMWN